MSVNREETGQVVFLCSNSCLHLVLLFTRNCKWVSYVFLWTMALQAIIAGKRVEVETEDFKLSVTNKTIFHRFHPIVSK